MHSNSRLPQIIKWGLVLPLFLPLVVTSSLFFPFITGKNILFRAIVEILAVLWVILFLNDKQYLPKKSWILYFIFAVVGVLTISTFIGADPNRSFWSNYERMEGLIGHLHLLIYFLVLASIMRSFDDWKKFFNISIIVSLLVGSYATLQLICSPTKCMIGGSPWFIINQGGDRIDATLGNATYLAAYFLFHLFFILYFYLKTNSKLLKSLYPAAFLFEAILLFLTATRGAILGFLGGILVFAIFSAFYSQNKKYKLSMAALFFGVLILVPSFYFIRDTNFIKNNFVLNRFRDISLTDTGNQARFTIWKMALEGWRERPIFGWGLENFNLVFNKYYDPSLYNKEPWYDRAHNVLFDWLIAGGIMGILSYLGLFAASIYYLWKKKGIEAQVFIALLAAYFFQNLFVFDELISYIMFFSVLGFIYFISTSGPVETRPNMNTQKSSPLVNKSLSQTFSAVVVIFFVFVFYKVEVKAYLENSSLIGALVNAGEGKIQNSLDSFKQALSYDSIGTRETREQLAQLATQVAQKDSIPQDLRSNIVSFSVSELKKQLLESPEDARYYLFIASVYQAAGRNAEAQVAFEKADQYSPNKQQILMELTSIYYQNKEYDKALATIQKIVNMTPNYPFAMSNMALVAISAGNDDLADKQIAYLQQKNMVTAEDLKRWANAYGLAKRFDKVVAIYQALVLNDSKNSDYAVGLASAYYTIGRSADAEKIITDFAAQNPSFKDQAAKIIEQLHSGK